MPLDKSGSKASVGKNIATEVAAGKPRKQAIAIALSTQRRAHKAQDGAGVRGIRMGTTGRDADDSGKITPAVDGYMAGPPRKAGDTYKGAGSRGKVHDLQPRAQAAQGFWGSFGTAQDGYVAGVPTGRSRGATAPAAYKRPNPKDTDAGSKAETARKRVFAAKAGAAVADTAAGAGKAGYMADSADAKLTRAYRDMRHEARVEREKSPQTRRSGAVAGAIPRGYMGSGGFQTREGGVPSFTVAT